MTKKLSIIVPCYCEEESIPLFYDAVEKVAPQLPDIELEYWFIDDGSSDNTLGELRKLQQKDPEHVHYASFSRNFGKEAGLYCGLQQATGDYVAVMDVDLQDPPELLPKMLGYLESGEYDCVGTRRVDRKGEPPIRSFFAHMFYKLINKISDTEIVDGARDYRLMTRQMVDAILSMSEYNRFSKGIFSWVGFKTKYLEYQNKERVAGKTSWNFWSLLKYSIDGIVSFSQTPLNIASYVGLLSSFRNCTETDLRRFSIRMGIGGMYFPFHWRNSTSLSWNRWKIHRQDFYGSQETSGIYHQRKKIRRDTLS